jgi:hypothetical protein
MQQVEQVFLELCLWKCPVILLVHDEDSLLLLVAGAPICSFILAGIVPTNYLSLDPFSL